MKPVFFHVLSFVVGIGYILATIIGVVILVFVCKWLFDGTDFSWAVPYTLVLIGLLLLFALYRAGAETLNDRGIYPRRHNKKARTQ